MAGDKKRKTNNYLTSEQLLTECTTHTDTVLLLLYEHASSKLVNDVEGLDTVRSLQNHVCGLAAEWCSALPLHSNNRSASVFLKNKIKKISIYLPIFEKPKRSSNNT